MVYSGRVGVRTHWSRVRAHIVIGKLNVFWCNDMGDKR